MDLPLFFIVDMTNSGHLWDKNRQIWDIYGTN